MIFRAPKLIARIFRFFDSKKLGIVSNILFSTIFFLLNKVLIIRSFFKPKRSVLFSGQCYYNCYYLSRALRDLNWRADVLNWDSNPKSQMYYHGEDYLFLYNEKYSIYDHLVFYLRSLFIYDIFHFSNAHGISFSSILQDWFRNKFFDNYEIFFLKKVNKTIVYSNNACLDGVSKTSFSKWSPASVCEICAWNQVPSVCSDFRNLKWGEFRNSVADYQINLGGNRADYNLSPTVHEVPEFYCLDPKIWNPNLEIPPRYFIKKNKKAILLYHGIGNMKLRTSDDGVNIHCSHIYSPIIKKIKKDLPYVEILSPSDVPNKRLRFLQFQCDIFLDMLTYGWYGAMAREAMMLGKPVICYIRPEWLEDVSREIPNYAEELPIVNATPQTVEEVLRDLISDRSKREEIGRRSSAFAFKWHSSQSGARRFDEIYSRLLDDDHQLLPPERFKKNHAT